MEPEEFRLSLADLGRIVVRHKGKMALFVLLVVVAVAVVTVLSPRAYRSQAKLFVRLGRENATLDPTVNFSQSPVVAVAQSRKTEINTAAEILKSRVLAERVIDALGPEAILGGPAAGPGPPTPETDDRRDRAIVKFTKLLDVEPVRRSNVLAVTYEGPTPELARAVVEKLLDHYLERHMQLNRTPGVHQFLAEQTERQRAELTRAEELLRDLKNATGLIAPESQRQLLVNRIGRLQDDLLQTASALAAAEAEARQLRDKLAGLAPTQVTARIRGVRNESADNLRGQVFALQMREMELRQRHPDGHPELERVRQQAAEAQDILRREGHDREQVTEGPSRVYEEAQLALLRQEPALTALRAKAEALRSQLDAQRAELTTLNENGLRLARLERDFVLQESHYRRYAENLEQAQIDRALEAERISNISLVQPATFELQPVRPRLLLNAGLGLLIALVGSFGLALAAERLNPAVGTTTDGGPRSGAPVPAADQRDADVTALNGSRM